MNGLNRRSRGGNTPGTGFSGPVCLGVPAPEEARGARATRGRQPRAGADATEPRIPL